MRGSAGAIFGWNPQMKITDILTPQRIIAQIKADAKPAILRELASVVATARPGLTADAVIAVLEERERLGSTAIGDGIAIPHGKLAGIDEIMAAFGRSPAGVEFDSLDGNPTQLFFVLVAPENSASLHLKALARVSRLLKDPGFRDKLIAAPDAAQIFQLIADEDARI
jgi:PTS system nitrogen regulatory IIA component